jgi:hypothetical protein
VAQVSLATDAGLVEVGAARTPGASVARVAMALSIPDPIVRKVGYWVDILEIAVDLADNLADAEEDRALGRDPTAPYHGLAPATLFSLPLLLVSTAIADLASWPVPIEHVRYTHGRLIPALDRLTRAQARPFGDPRRYDEGSASRGVTVLLPLWMTFGPAWPDDPRFAALEAWQPAWSRTWQARQDVAEGRLDPATYRTLVDQATAAWPDFPPFQPGQALAVDRMAW